MAEKSYKSHMQMTLMSCG